MSRSVRHLGLSYSILGLLAGLWGSWCVWHPGLEGIAGSHAHLARSLTVDLGWLTAGTGACMLLLGRALYRLDATAIGYAYGTALGFLAFAAALTALVPPLGLVPLVVDLVFFVVPLAFARRRLAATSAGADADVRPEQDGAGDPPRNDQ